MNELSSQAESIFKKKYAVKLKNGNKEAWEQCAARVSTYVAQGEEREVDYLQYSADFTKIISDRVFIPGGRILANAGTGIKNLMNCFVLPINDSRESIYSTLKNAAEIFAWGGGIGYNLSNLREQGAEVKTTGGLASGPVSFMELFDTTGEVISQASRRGAQMGILNVDHPDILKFIKHKNNLTEKNKRMLDEFEKLCHEKAYSKSLKTILANNQLTHFNISVAVSDLFMDAVTKNGIWRLNNRGNSSVSNTSAKELFHAIAENAWENGDPGIYFIDRANEDNLVPYLGDLNATNPCGEIPLLSFEACCLGSINLYSFVDGEYFDYQYLEDIIKYAVRFLDDVQTINDTPVDEINKKTKLTRRLGLGVMGLADVLAEMHIPYNHTDALAFSKELAKFIQTTAWKYSQQLADEKGSFPIFYSEKINWKLLDKLGIERKPIRNVAITSIAPTGTIALMADVNSGIEPFFAKKYKRNVTSGIGNVAEAVLDTNIKYEDALTAHDISWREHINMQAVWQSHVDNAVSKTINMPNNATVEEIEDAYTYAWESGCKGITIYRDRSRNFQILNI